MSDLEDELRGLFRRKESDVPTPRRLSEYLGDRESSSRSRWLVVPVLVAATAAVVVGAAQLSPMEGDVSTSVAGPSSPADPDRETRRGAIPVDAATYCVEEYSPQTVANRAFAFDGTVADIAPGTTNRDDRGRLPLASVTFDVNEWFAGGTGASVTVDMDRPREDVWSEDSGPTYEVGTRLLVSGEPRWGGTDPLKDGIAWGGCGFTRYWDEQTADQWRATADLGRVVTQVAELEGRQWQAEVLFGRPVVQPKGTGSHPVDVVFSQAGSQWTWRTDDGCNRTSGMLAIDDDGLFTTGSVGATYVACLDQPGRGREHASNVEALKMTDQAQLTVMGVQPQVLKLLSQGEVVAVYVSGAGRD